MYKKYLAEFIGTFALTFIVLRMAVEGSGLSVFVALVASVTLGLFVYTIGSISGCHINPAITLGQLLIRKISFKNAGFYIIVQFLGALAAWYVSNLFGVSQYYSLHLPVRGMFELQAFLAEMLGAFFFAFGIASVVYGKAKEQMSGFVVGGSLLFGAVVATLSGAIGILNPAVAAALLNTNISLTILYITAPIVGAVLGFQVYKFMVDGQ
ncbi:MAG: aquaporin [Candidatus Magasanikbacteria bacterium]|nr:aquaporin [Candidatus Magasanikbacteria bacterium]